LDPIPGRSFWKIFGFAVKAFNWLSISIILHMQIENKMSTSKEDGEFEHIVKHNL
jgi:hypothetical protein